MSNLLDKIKDKVEEEITMPFSAMVRKKTKGQTFGRPKLTKAGKEFDVHNWIQEGRDDTEIYPTLEKYGCLERMELDHEALFGDMTEMSDLRGTIERAKKAEELWNGLPIEVRTEFNNDKSLFAEQGLEWLKKKIDEKKKTTTEQGTVKEKETNTDAQ